MPPKLPAQGAPVAKYAGFLVAGIIVGLLLAWGWSAMRSGSGDSMQEKNGSNVMMKDTTKGEEAMTSEDLQLSSLVVPSPQKAGFEVAITRAVVSRPTWVVVYESRDGAPGNALGAALFFPGVEKGSVELLRGTAVGQTYFVGEQTDDGDRIFSLRGDQIVRAQDGAELLVSFVAQ